MRGFRAVRVVASLGLLVAGLAVVSVSPAAAVAVPVVSEVKTAVSPCQNVTWVGARGSGESTSGNRGMGKFVNAAFSRFTKAGFRSTNKVGYYALTYPAQDVKTLGLVVTKPSPYFQGMDTGFDEALDFLKNRQKRCPNELFVLSGYSQGAMIMHRLLFRLNAETGKVGGIRLKDRIAGTLLLADGDRLWNEGGQHYGTLAAKDYDQVNDRGVGVVMSAFDPSKHKVSTKPLPSWAAEHLYSVCDRNDLVCDPVRSLALTGWQALLDKLAGPRASALFKTARAARGIYIHITDYGADSSYVSAAVKDMSASVILSVDQLAKPTISTKSLPKGTVGTAYDVRLRTTDNRSGKWTLRTGTLPAGLALVGDCIQGTPTANGTSSFQIKFTDTAGYYDVRPTGITVGGGGGSPGTPPSQVGAAYAGGIYVGTTQDDSGKQYALVASPSDLQFAPYAQDPYTLWDSYCLTQPGRCGRVSDYRRAPVASAWDGLANTQGGAAVDDNYMIFKKVSAISYPNDGGSPWYVPAKNELNLLWQGLGESGLAFDYTKNGSTYQVWWLWSSTEYCTGTTYTYCAEDAWGQVVRGSGGGYQYGYGKGYGSSYNGVRPVRRIPL